MGDSSGSSSSAKPEETDVNQRGEAAPETEEVDMSEAQIAKGIPAPEAPTAKEKEEHARTYLPFRQWCDICVKARGIADRHSSKPADPDRYRVPQLVLDFWFMGGLGSEGRDSLPVLTMYERMREALSGHRVDTKGVEPATIRQLIHDLNSMGIKRAVYKSDQEPAIRAILEALQREWKEGELVPESSPKGDKDSNGMAETSVKSHEFDKNLQIGAASKDRARNPR